MARFFSDPLKLLIAAFVLSMLGIAGVMLAPPSVAAVLSLVTLPAAILLFAIASFQQIRRKARRVLDATRAAERGAARAGREMDRDAT